MSAKKTSPEKLLELFIKTDEAVKDALSGVEDWGLVAENSVHPGQHYPDVAADTAAMDVLKSASIAVMSEESGFYLPDGYGDYSSTEFDVKDLSEGELLVVMDPLDGSSNAAKRIPFYALSLCAIDNQGPVAGFVSNLACPGLAPYTAIRGQGAQQGTSLIQPSSATELKDATVALTFFVKEGMPAWLEEAQRIKCLGAAALELCLVAAGALDVYVDTTIGLHAPWDYLAGGLICQEAGAEFIDAQDRSTTQISMEIRRQPLAASSVELLKVVQGALSSAG